MTLYNDNIYDDGTTSRGYDDYIPEEGLSGQLNGGPQDDIVIAVMGATGSGKSSFIKLLTDNADVHVGDGLDSETENIQIVPFLDATSGRNVVIVDTPGFDDSRPNISDTDILKKITDFLLTEYDKHRKLNGLIYLQRISDPRFSGQSRRNLLMFRNLCGTKAYENVVALTTFWDQVSNQEGVKREQQMRTKFFQDLARGGARFMRHDRTIESARKVLQHVLTLAPTNVLIQDEIRLEGKTLEETAAGSVHREEVARIIEKHKKDIADLKEELDKMRNNNSNMRRELEQERDKLKHELVRWETERTDLKKGLDEAKGAQEQLSADVAEEKKEREKQMEHKSWEYKLAVQRHELEKEMWEMQRQLDRARWEVEKKNSSCIIC
ncbi:hypothetical protein AX15_004545 [Amanita polypyramis BW_CC]|nr:hypothetical protein AX15_004545 [Amanita polypyramis BW_CC]